MTVVRGTDVARDQVRVEMISTRTIDEGCCLLWRPFDGAWNVVMSVSMTAETEQSCRASSEHSRLGG